ncbi:hypothetical protein BGX38DRAFT_349234 [Terfezia claveryi]|nr:hypothetical protein BGX38DRAFT_349234 [Terfezia claveryi]
MPSPPSYYANPLAEAGHTPDEARVYKDICEPFMLTVREIGPKDTSSSGGISLHLTTLLRRGRILLFWEKVTSSRSSLCAMRLWLNFTF